MRLLCYRTCSDQQTQEQIWLCADHVHAHAVTGYCEFYIREDRLAFALLLDPNMLHVKHKDLII